MRYLWCAAVLALTAGAAAGQDMPLSQVLIPGEGWVVALKDCKSAGALAGDGRGNAYAADPDGLRIRKIDKEGKAAVFSVTAAAVRGLAVGPGGKVYASEPDKRRIVTIDDDGAETVFAEKLAATDLAVTKAGAVYAAVPDESAVYRIGPDGKERVVDQGIAAPAALVLWADGGTLAVGDAKGKHLYAFRVDPNGDLSAKERYYPLRVPRNQPDQPSEASGATADDKGRVYVTTREGLQVFDPTGRLSGVVLSPEPAPPAGVAFGGADLDRLYVACGGKVYVRKVQAKGVKAEKTGP
jgi:sugar lactone lactonase YvrE